MSEVLRACAATYPERPALNPAEWPYTRDELERRVDYWMHALDGIAAAPTDGARNTADQ